jgi:ABC-2 type transport system ATP-binding protein
MEKVIEVKNLVKKYDRLTAVDSISFEVKKGEIFGLLGENGAGKTTTLEIIEGLRKPSSGTIEVLGYDVLHELSSIKEKIGVQLQSSAYYYFLNLKEILSLFGSFYEKNISPNKLLSMVELENKSKSLINALSGGQKQRFSIVASLVNDPEIVFLDEPTTGLDPVARRHLWNLISEIKSQGKTIVLTTHYMEEAEVLCDRIAIMEKGRIVAMDDTHKLIEKTKNPFRISFIAPKLSESDISQLEKIGKLANVAKKEYLYELRIKNQKKVNEALKIIQAKSPESLNVSRASLEDLFIELTGKAIAKEENA